MGISHALNQPTKPPELFEVYSKLLQFHKGCVLLFATNEIKSNCVSGFWLYIEFNIQILQYIIEVWSIVKLNLSFPEDTFTKFSAIIIAWFNG